MHRITNSICPQLLPAFHIPFEGFWMGVGMICPYIVVHGFSDGYWVCLPEGYRELVGHVVAALD